MRRNRCATRNKHGQEQHGGKVFHDILLTQFWRLLTSNVLKDGEKIIMVFTWDMLVIVISVVKA